MKRRDFLRRSATGIAGLSVGTSLFSNMDCSGARMRRPNILFILADDAGWNDVGYHNPEIHTPNIDRLARDGVELDRFYVSPVCSPTRAALLTGRHPSRFGILGPIVGGDKETLPKEATTLAECLQQQGYRTAICGKWHLGLKPEDGPRQYGFQHSYGYFHGQIDPYTHLYKFGDKTWHRDDSYIDEPGHATDLITEEAVRTIEGHAEGKTPFFLYVAYSVPHFPIDEEAKWLEHYPESMHPDRRKFAAAMTHMDAGIGRILAAVAEKGLTEETMIFFMSDNGGQENFRSGPDYYNNKFPPAAILGDNRPLRGWKGELYEGGIRVPACIYWPARLSPRRIDQTIAVEDVFPTLAALLRVKVDIPFDGSDIWRVLQGERLEERTLYWRTHHQVAVRRGGWKLIRSTKADGAVVEELFHIDQDPGERINLILQNQTIAASLRQALERKMAGDRV